MRNLLTPALLVALASPMAAPAKSVTRSNAKLNCVSVNSNDSITPFDDSSVYIRTGVRKGYIARFVGGRCPSLRASSTLIVERFGAQACSGDRIRPLNPPEIIPGPTCIIDTLEPYTEPARKR